MGLHKPFFTENLSTYRRLLEYLNAHYHAEISARQQIIDHNEKILELIRKSSSGKQVSEEDMTELVKISCPPFSDLYTFNDENEDSVASLEDAFKKSQNEIVVDCSTTNCKVCWRNYINQMAKVMNQIDFFANVDPTGGNNDAD